ncbi:hypothetical protein GQ43DRAFT_22185 [Delitschia confertaspora ATCC 74209]|uniref:CTLH domain-containing protein n=1 Tax=Delitschia confertaspora ATCC 74209 TaxID=1513339 RepID=A0A9P4JR62_9PLEO|nr:hypothetical protein GQ43DRAFT_22185 [Delitschia confertaspora ATCC 74209]
MSSATASASAAMPTPASHPFMDKLNDIKASKADINLLIMDYLISEGYPRAAQKFAKEAKIQAPAEESIQARVEIRNAIHAGDIETAIAKINDLNPQILDTDPALHFSLLRLQLVELIRKCTQTSDSDITPALTFASSQLAPRAPTNPAFLHQLETTMALLLLPPEKFEPPHSELLQPSFRRGVANDVNEAILASMGAQREARLRNLVRLRAWAEHTARNAGKDLPAILSFGIHAEGGTDGMHGSGDAGDAMAL